MAKPKTEKESAFKKLDRCVDANYIIMDLSMMAVRKLVAETEQPVFYGPDNPIPDGFFMTLNAVFHACRKDIGADQMTDEDRDLLIEEYQIYRSKALEAIRKERTEKYGASESESGPEVKRVST